MFYMDKLFARFMGQGRRESYPHTVSDDYLEYQIWDTAQALASSLTAALSVEAVLRGAGVGNETATPLAASLTWLVKDGLGMIGRIAFTYCKGGPKWKKENMLESEAWENCEMALNDGRNWKQW
ncbi:hypothetical protein WR25_00681 [Diploscapter pachys]|uniref:Protein root UVB sensitive/RUS domain-containing protein n=1 Tax=Diploscapter pachys TaxID=2018661 RepID=A0A2A2JJ35_9BILA|nr:hypothetical protein WR25_00681 [Diploscapter pachys]